MTRVSHIAAGLGPSIPASVLAEVAKKRATVLNLHQNKLRSLFVLSGSAVDFRRERGSLLAGACVALRSGVGGEGGTASNRVSASKALSRETPSIGWYSMRMLDWNLPMDASEAVIWTGTWSMRWTME